MRPPRCLPRALHVHFKIPRCRSHPVFLDPLSSCEKVSWHAFRLVLTRNTGELFGQVRLYQYYAITQIVISYRMLVDVSFYPRWPFPFSLH